MASTGKAERLPRDSGRHPPRAQSHLPRWQRSLLPAMLGVDHADRSGGEGVDLKRSLRDWVVDLVLFLGALGTGVGGVWNDHRTTSTPLFILDVVIAVPAVGALWVRRRRPFWVGLIAIGGAAVSDGASGAALVAMFSAAIYCRPRRVAGLFCLALVSDAITPLIYSPRGSYTTHDLALGAATIIATVFGGFVRVRRDLVRSLQERAHTLHG